MKPKILLLSITLLVTLAACSGSSENLVKTCEIEQLRTLAEQGKADAQFNLYEALRERKCGTNSPEEAKSWLVKAAENGHTGSHSLDGAMGLLAVAYDPFFDRSVIGIKKDVSIDQLLHNGHLAFTVIESKSNKRYQGIIPVQKGSFSKCINYYFKKSEQINSEIICFSEFSNKTYISSAILIQVTPEELDNISENQINLFGEASLFLKSLNKSELLSRQISMENILYKLFHSFEVRTQKEITIKDNCKCSLDKVKNTLFNISNAELDELTFSDGSLEVICEFCKNLTKLSRQDLFSIRKSINS